MVWSFRKADKMSILLLVILFGVLLMVGLFATVRSQGRPVSSLDDFQALWIPVDLPALMNLMDTGEERYLRENLTPRDFRLIHRKRLAVTWEYLSRIGANARLMVQAGQIIQHTCQGEESLEARVLVNDSIRLRTKVLTAQFSIATKFVLPGMVSPITSVLDQYSQVRGSLEQAFAQRKIHAVSRAV